MPVLLDTLGASIFLIETLLYWKSFAMYETQRTKSIATTAILCPIAILAVLLRFLARSRTRANYAADDWLAVVTLMSLLVWFALYVWCMYCTCTRASLSP